MKYDYKIMADILRANEDRVFEMGAHHTIDEDIMAGWDGRVEFCVLDARQKNVPRVVCTESPISRLKREIDKTYGLSARGPWHIRLHDMLPLGELWERPIPDDELELYAAPRGAREVLVHPETWDDMARSCTVSAEHERVRRSAGWRNGARFCGIPVIDDSSAARARRAGF